MLHKNSKPDYDYQCKIVLAGDFGVGKSSIFTRFTRTWGLDFKTTIGIEFATKMISVENKVIKAQIWDTSGSEKYRALPAIYYRGIAGALLVYDITKYQTFANIEKWLGDLRNNTESNIVVMMVGNKTDLDSLRAVSHEEATEFAEKHGIAFIEVSALDCSNVDLAFEKVAAEILKNLRNVGTGSDGAFKIKKSAEEKSGCC